MLLRPRSSYCLSNPRFSPSFIRLSGPPVCRYWRCFRTTAPRGSNSQSLVPPISVTKSPSATHDHVLRAGTIIARDPSSTHPTDILSKINPLPLTTNCDTSLRHNAVVIFSKAFAGLADDDHFLRQVVGKLFASYPNGDQLEVQAVVAVVDRIPAPRNLVQEHDELELVQHGHSYNHGESRQKAFEGLAFLADGSGRLLSHIQTEPDEQNAKAPAPRAQGSLSDGTGTLSLQLRADRGKSSNIGKLELPLADTLFINGRRCVLMETQWRRGRAQDDFDLVKSQSTTHVLVSLNRRSSTSGTENLTSIPPSLSTPLAPLTPLRKVSDSMGNVIRKIEVDSEIGASIELEQSISAYFSTHDIPPQTVAVWAIVVPQNISNKIQDNVTSPEQLLLMGASLHRVLSGGGGWGNKAGLVSLDPDVGFAPRPSNSPVGSLGLAGNGPERMVRPIAQPGDYLAFYVLSPSRSAPSETGMIDSQGEHESVCIELGVIPSTDDETSTSWETAYPSDITAHGKDSTSSVAVEHFDNYFGALSEKGISLQTQSLDASSQDVQTKIDVPFTLLTQHIFVAKGAAKPAVVKPKPNSKLNDVQKKKYRTTQARSAVTSTLGNREFPIKHLVSGNDGEVEKIIVKSHVDGEDSPKRAKVLNRKLMGKSVTYSEYAKMENWTLIPMDIAEKERTAQGLFDINVRRIPVATPTVITYRSISEGGTKLKIRKITDRDLNYQMQAKVKFWYTGPTNENQRTHPTKGNISSIGQSAKVEKARKAFPGLQRDPARPVPRRPRFRFQGGPPAIKKELGSPKEPRVVKEAVKVIKHLVGLATHLRIKWRSTVGGRRYRMYTVPVESRQRGIAGTLRRSARANGTRPRIRKFKMFRIRKFWMSRRNKMGMPRIRKVGMLRIRMTKAYLLAVRNIPLGSIIRKHRTDRQIRLAEQANELRKRRAENPWQMVDDRSPEERMDEIRGFFEELMGSKPGKLAALRKV